MVARRGLLKAAAFATLGIALAGTGHISSRPTAARNSGTLTLLPSSALSYLGHADFAFTSTDANAVINFSCSQNGQVVLGIGIMNPSIYGPTPTSFALGPTQAWTGGAATCTATLLDFYDIVSKHNPRPLAPVVTFNVSG